MIKVTITYFAMLKELSGETEEQISTNAKTVSELYEQLKTRYNFPLKLNQLAAAINDEFVKLDTPIKSGDRIVFIPPVAGG